MYKHKILWRLIKCDKYNTVSVITCASSEINTGKTASHFFPEKHKSLASYPLSKPNKQLWNLQCILWTCSNLHEAITFNQRLLNQHGGFLPPTFFFLFLFTKSSECWRKWIFSIKKKKKPCSKILFLPCKSFLLYYRITTSWSLILQYIIWILFETLHWIHKNICDSDHSVHFVFGSKDCYCL